MIHRLNEDNCTYSYEDYEFNGIIIRMKAKNFEQNDTMVYTHQFRGTKNNIELMSLQSISDFFQDIGFIFSNLQGKEPNTQNLWDAYFTTVGNHINKCNRLIDTDIEGFLDSILKVVVALSDSLNMEKISNEDGEELRIDFRNSTYEAFADYIWLSRKIDNLNPLSKWELVKYTDQTKKVAY